MNGPLFIETRAVKQQIDRLKLDFPELEEDVQLLADSCEGETNLHEVLTRLVREERDALTFADAIKAQEKALAERRGRFERRQEFYRSLMLSLMEAAGQSKLPLPEATLSISHGAPKVVVDSEADVPDDFCRFNRWPDLTAIKTAFKDGRSVPGTHLTNGSTTLAIRVK